jgi:hypothetical protein
MTCSPIRFPLGDSRWKWWRFLRPLPCSSPDLESTELSPMSLMNKDVRSPFASRWELKEAPSSRWSFAGASVWPPLAPGWAWPERSSSLTSWPDCTTACRGPISPPSSASPLCLPPSRSLPAVSRRCAPCASIQSRRSIPNNFVGLLENCRRKLLPPQRRLGRLGSSLKIEPCRISTRKRQCRLSNSAMRPDYICAHPRPDLSSYVG